MGSRCCVEATHSESISHTLICDIEEKNKNETTQINNQEIQMQKKSPYVSLQVTLQQTVTMKTKDTHPMRVINNKTFLNPLDDDYNNSSFFESQEFMSYTKLDNEHIKKIKKCIIKRAIENKKSNQIILR